MHSFSLQFMIASDIYQFLYCNRLKTSCQRLRIIMNNQFAWFEFDSYHRDLATELVWMELAKIASKQDHYSESLDSRLDQFYSPSNYKESEYWSGSLALINYRHRCLSHHKRMPIWDLELEEQGKYNWMLKYWGQVISHIFLAAEFHFQKNRKLSKFFDKEGWVMVIEWNLD